MNNLTNEKLNHLKSLLKICSNYKNAISVLNFDLETICPSKAMEDEGNTIGFLSNEVFKITHSDEFIKEQEYLFEHLEEIEHPLDKKLIESLHRDYIMDKNITEEFNVYANKVFSKAYLDWLEAKKTNNYKLFKPSLEKIREIDNKYRDLCEIKYDTAYDYLLDNEERGVTTEDLDKFFSKLKKGVLEILAKIKASKVEIRDDFLSRKVSVHRQEEFSQYLMKLIGFDLDRGCLSTTEHPFTDTLGRNDSRITTHYYEDSFISNIFTIVHEGGHAIFFQNQNEEDYDHFIDNHMTNAMHESVSRFYENRIARSKEFIHLIFPKLKETFNDILYDVTEEELYKAINKVQTSLIRTEADELTYALHIIVRYEIEKDIMNNNLDLDKLPEIWNAKYKEYLGVDVPSDTEGVLQDVHWASGFGYFPSYALGNAINAMYYNEMNKTVDIKKCVLEGDFKTINSWMKEHVFKKSNILPPKEWLQDIVGSDLDPQVFLDYLDEKYKDIYKY